MAKFTTIENLINQAYQSIVGSLPEHGRVELGTKTLDNRDYWENINFNQDTFQPHLTGKLETLKTEVRDGIVYRRNIETSVVYQYSVDALPFVTDPNNGDEIIRLDEYYDKKNNSTEYYLATEGKINYYLYARESGRPTPDGHIDNYSTRNTLNRFDSYAQNVGDTGFYLFKLNWGDGSTIEYIDRPKLLEKSVLLEHYYEKPGFYTISGTVYALYSPEGQQSIGGYERFETNILLNPSKNYEFNLYDYDNFATIGGIDLDSSLIKSSLNTIGINPINTLDIEKASSENIEKFNLLDKLQLFNFLNKMSDSFLDKFIDLLTPYSQEFDNTSIIQFGNAYDITLNEISEAGVDDGVSIDLINFNINQSEPYIEGDEIELVVFFVTGYDHLPSDVQLRPFITTPENLNIELIEDNSFTSDWGTEYRNARYKFIMPSQDVEITATAFLPIIEFEVNVIGIAPLGNTQAYVNGSQINGNNPTIPYEVLSDDNVQIVLNATEIQNEGMGESVFQNWEIVSGDNFENDTIELSSLNSPQTILTINKDADSNNFGTIQIRAIFFENEVDTGDDTGGDETGGDETGGDETGGGGGGGTGGKQPGDTDIDPESDPELNF